MKHGIRVVGLLSAMLLTGSVWAQDYDDGGDKVQASDIAHALSGRPWYVSGMFSYVDSDSDRGYKAGIVSIVSVGQQVTRGLALALTGYYTIPDAKHGWGRTELG